MSSGLILLVDDEASIVKLAQMYLEREGYQVQSVGDGMLALQFMRASQPDLLVLDENRFSTRAVFRDPEQYPEGLEMKIWLYKITGDVDKINGLNHYIGMKLIHEDEFPEFKMIPYR